MCLSPHPHPHWLLPPLGLFQPIPPLSSPQGPGVSHRVLGFHEVGGLLFSVSTPDPLGLEGPEMDPVLSTLCVWRGKARPTDQTEQCHAPKVPASDRDGKEEGPAGGGGLSPPCAGRGPSLRAVLLGSPEPLHVSPAINSCAVGNGGCQHDCVQLTVTQHRCQCRPEFRLQEDGKHCVRECEPSGAGDPVLHAPTGLPRDPAARPDGWDIPPCMAGWEGALWGAAPFAAERWWACYPSGHLGKPGRLCSGVAHLWGAGRAGEGHGGG